GKGVKIQCCWLVEVHRDMQVIHAQSLYQLVSIGHRIAVVCKCQVDNTLESCISQCLELFGCGLPCTCEVFTVLTKVKNFPELRVCRLQGLGACQRPHKERNSSNNF